MSLGRLLRFSDTCNHHHHHLLYFYLFERQIGTSYLLVHPPDVHNSLGRARPGLGQSKELGLQSRLPCRWHAGCWNWEQGQDADSGPLTWDWDTVSSILTAAPSACPTEALLSIRLAVPIWEYCDGDLRDVSLQLPMKAVAVLVSRVDNVQRGSGAQKGRLSLLVGGLLKHTGDMPLR